MKQVIKLKNYLSRQKTALFTFVKKEPKVSISLFVIFLIAVFFRTYDYYNRIYVYADNTLFAQLAYYAKAN